MNAIKTFKRGLILSGIALLIPFLGYAAPSGFQIDTILSGLNLPTDVVLTEDGSHIFVAEKNGVVRVAHNETLLPTPAYTIQNINTYNDRGLLGIALDPNFDVNNYLYVLYTYENNPLSVPEDVKTGQLLRVTLDANHVAIPGSEFVVLGNIVGNSIRPSCTDYPSNTDCIASDGSSHTVADLTFGPDGMLYVATGDASSFATVDPLAHRALDLESLNGKVLRIDATTGEGLVDNPYYTGNTNDNASKVWNLGLRNPFRISFRPSNGSLYIGDVGWYTYEEINLGTAGANFGWPCYEGIIQTPGYDCVTTGPTSTPLYEYLHDETTSAGSVTGGVFYNSGNYPSEYNDTYFVGDFAQNWIKRIVVDSNDNFVSIEDFELAAADGPVAFNTDINGNIIFLSIYTGELRRIVYTGGNTDPIITMSATPPAGLSPLQVQFSSASTTDPEGDPITFLWDFGTGATSSAPNPIYTYTVNGTYTATLTVTDDTTGTAQSALVITVGDEAPTAFIDSPPNNSFYSAGQFIQLGGTGIDPEDGILAGSQLSWKILLNHNIHPHILETLTGSNPGFFAPDHGENTGDAISIEVELTVTDSAGLTDVTSVNLQQAATSGFNPQLVQSYISPPTPQLGQLFTITTDIINNGTTDGNVLVDFELYDENNVKVADSVYDNEFLPSGATQSYTLQSTLNTTGIYRLAFGLIYPGWAGLYEWTSEALLFNVDNGSLWEPVTPNGALEFDGVDDYIETNWWDIEEIDGFTFESRFRASSFNGDTNILAKSSDATPGSYDFLMGLREVSTTTGTILFRLKTDTGTTELVGGAIQLNTLTQISVSYSALAGEMKIYKDGVLVSQIAKTGLVSTSLNDVWLGNVPADPTVGGFHGLIDEIRVWNRPRTEAEIFSVAFIEQPGPEFNLIKNWKFNEGWGQVAFDTSGAGHHGQLGSTSLQDINDPLYYGGTYPQGGTFNPSFTSAVTTPDPVISGATTTFDVTLTNVGNGAGHMILNFMITDSAGLQVYGDATGILSFAAGESQILSFDWPPTTAGTYNVRVGLTYPFWNGLYDWIDPAYTFVVEENIGNNAPTIAVQGDNPLLLNVGATYIDQGATANDIEDGDITSAVVVSGDIVNTSVAGSYSVFYDVTDSGGLNAIQQSRTVTVTEIATGTPTISVVSSVVSTPIEVGTPVVATVTVRNDGGAGSTVVALVIFDQGIDVYSETYFNEPFLAGEERNLTITFTPTHLGSYGVDMGVWEADYSAFQNWFSNVAGFTATDNTPQTQINIYTDTLAPGWASWSWGTTLNPSGTTQVASGTNAMEITHTEAWGGAFLHSDGTDTTGFTNLVFEVNGGTTGGQELQILSLDAANELIQGVPLSNYIGAIDLTWQTVTIPLIDLGLVDVITNGFIIQDASGAIQSTYYIDTLQIN